MKKTRHLIIFLSLLLLSITYQECAFADNSSSNAALNAYQQGKLPTAIKLWTRSAETALANKDYSSVVDSLWRKAEAQRTLGRHKVAVISLEKARRLYDKKGLNLDENKHALVLASYGDSLSHLGSVANAVKLLQQAITISRKLGNDLTLAITLNNFGNVLVFLDDLTAAQLAYEEASELSAKQNNTNLQSKVLANQVKAYQQQDNITDASEKLKLAIALSNNSGGLRNKTFSLIGLGNLAWKQYELELKGNKSYWIKESFNLLDAADVLARASGDTRSESYAAGYLGQVYASQKRYDDAIQLTNRATQAAQKINAPESEYLWHWQNGRIHKKQGNIDAAISAYRLAVEKIQSIRGQLAARSAFKEVLGPVFFELTDLLLQRPEGLSNQEDIQSYLKEARSTMELLKAAELQDYFQDNCVTALQSKTSGLDNLQSRTAVLYPIILEDRIEILLSLSNGIERSVTKIDSYDLKAKITNFRVLLEKRTTHQYMRYGRELYDLMIRPMEATLNKNKIDTLVIIPDSALRTVPLSALHDGKEFLISKYALATTPGLTLTDPKPLDKKKLKVLVGGLTDGVQGFSPLPNVAIEVEHIKKTYDSTVLMDKTYVASNVEKELEKTNFNVVHIASHAQFSSDPDETFLLAYSDKFSMDRLEALMGTAKFRDDPVELLTLSACQTAAGDERAALGLAGIAIKAGARSALATLWYINDQASSVLVSKFYDKLRVDELSKAKALQQAQLSLMKDKRYQHPSYWSPFLLIGNWL
ncbi:MAG: CHAT domain-containing protein [Sulfuriflexus sp.]|nr:CHAT domain-containing protein [Sulfuriflexus sp.]